MSFTADSIQYEQTGAFSKIVSDYLSGDASLRPFYNYTPDINGINKAIEDRKQFPVDRNLLCTVLEKQYGEMAVSEKLRRNISALRDENTFTICTAHQPNIFTGHLYFIYKILHAIKLADELSNNANTNKFVPVFYVGSEDADLDELGEVFVHGTQYRWNTDQKGAVGRMKIDSAFENIITQIEGRIAVEKNGASVIRAMRDAYVAGTSVAEATFQFVHHLFNAHGLVILMPDSRALKAAFAPEMKKELEENFSEKALKTTLAAFPKQYKHQAAGRDINLFYLGDGTRDRIEKRNASFFAGKTGQFTPEEMFDDLKRSPEKFSPNVILRPLYQEAILPDVAFIGGGGELAYWLELKNVFAAANVFFPVLLLRNSFTVIKKNIAFYLTKLSLAPQDVFTPPNVLMESFVKARSAKQLSLAGEKAMLNSAFKKIKSAAGNVDLTLAKHTDALAAKAIDKIDRLEKKMLKAEKINFEAEQHQLAKIRAALFPGETLQERRDNILEYLAAYGDSFLQTLYENSQAVPHSFTILTEK